VLTLAELVRAWFGRTRGEAERTIVQAALAGGQPWFLAFPELEVSSLHASSGRRAGPGSTRRPARRPGGPQGIDKMAIKVAVDRHLGGAAGLYRLGIDPATGDVTLYFTSPDRARGVHPDAIAAVRSEAGPT
jgi:hypothetical protein